MATRTGWYVWYPNLDGRWKWQVCSANGHATGESSRSYPTEERAHDAFSRFLWNMMPPERDQHVKKFTVILVPEGAPKVKVLGGFPMSKTTR